MKRNILLLGFYVALLACGGGSLKAQTAGFYEIGPDNIGGHVSCLVVDVADTNRNTLYAGASSGGLFLKSPCDAILRNLYEHLGLPEARVDELASLHDIWHHVPFLLNDREASLPISAMSQAPSGEIFIGTGSDTYSYGSTYDRMSRMGMGVFCYVPATNEFRVLSKSVPSASDTNFKSVNAVVSYFDHDASGDVLYLYVATNAGLYRWAMVGSREDWNFASTPTTVFNGRVDHIVLSRYFKTAFFNSGNSLYRLGDVTASPANLHPVDISSSNSAFGGSNVDIKLAVTQNDTLVAYAMVINQNGYMEGLYMTTDEQTWHRVTTSSIMPLTYNSGRQCGALAIDPANSRRVIVGGTNVLVGQGFVDGAYYQWTTSSASEHELNYGDYMAYVYGNTSFVHSGIHQIVPVFHVNGDRTYHTVYFATDGGVYSSKFYGRDGFDSIKNENRGLNNLEINGLAVTPDGAVLMGAADNACPIVESRLTHAGGQPTLSWYDDGSLGNFNHSANVLWYGNGGAVAASSFQQVYPLERRTIITTSGNGSIGRSYADYLDYTNATTWTTGSSFITEEPQGGPTIGYVSLWETDQNTAFNSTLKVAVDTLGYIMRKKNNVWDTVWVNDTIHGNARGGNFQIKRGDKAVFNSRAHADYPFEYTFTANQRAKDSLVVKNPVQARMLFIADKPGDQYSAPSRTVWFSWNPIDFTKVYDSVEYHALEDAHELHDIAGLYENYHVMSPILNVQRNAGTINTNLYPREAVFSRDAFCVFVSAYEVTTHRSMLFRISGFEDVDYTSKSWDLYGDLSYRNTQPILHVDTLRYNGNIWFPRPISHIAVDGREGQDRIVLTFEDYSDAMTNVAIVNDASTSSYTVTEIPMADVTLPVYTAIVEDSTGMIFAGTADGVYTKSAMGSWQSYNNLSGVPVTAIVQQTAKLPIRRNLTHTGITANKYVFAKTKWPRAIYFGTYGRGVFMDMKYVTDTVNEIVDSSDYNQVSIPMVHGTGVNGVKLFPNPVYDEARMLVDVAAGGKGELRLYDLNGRMVMRRDLGHVTEGEHAYSIDCRGLSKGMYLINVTISGQTATTKMVVR